MLLPWEFPSIISETEGWIRRVFALSQAFFALKHEATYVSLLNKIE